MLMPSRKYEELSIIGRGAYGTVFKARDIENDRVVALKRVRIGQSNEEKGVPVSTLREISLLKQLDNMSHPNIVRVFDAFQTKSTTPMDNPADLILTIVFEHVDQDLSSFLHNFPSPGLSENLIKDLMYQLLSGVDYLHINRIVHRDIKPQNVLITKNRQVKIADFGLARIYGFCKLVTSVVVTLWYRAPEVLLQCTYATKVDLWSVGAIMVEMYNRRPLFPGKSDIDQLHKILSIIGSPEKRDWPENVSIPFDTFIGYKGIDLQHLINKISATGLDLITKLLVFDPSKRLNAFRSLAHPYFTEADFASKPVVVNGDQVEKKVVSSDERVKFSTSSVSPDLQSSESGFPKQKDIYCIINEENRSTNRSFSRVDSGICLSPQSEVDTSSQGLELSELTDKFACASESDQLVKKKQNKSTPESNYESPDNLSEKKEIKVCKIQKKAPKRKRIEKT